MSKHTPGPWEAVYNGSSSWSIGQAEDPQDLPPFVIINDRNDDRARANVYLIAAAPDLLKACKTAEAALNNIIEREEMYGVTSAEGVRDALDFICGAVAKAEAPDNA